MGWDCRLDAQAGTGLIVGEGFGGNAAHHPRIKRLPANHRDNAPDVIVIDAGRNDRFEPLARFERAISDYPAAIHRVYPNAELVWIVPYWMGTTVVPHRDQVAQFIRQKSGVPRTRHRPLRRGADQRGQDALDDDG